MNSQIDRLHLKQVGLTLNEMQLLALLLHTGGEYPMPETPEGLAVVKGARAKNLVQVVQRYGENQRVRLTDEGRVVLSQLEAMAVQPKVEVEMHGDTPKVIKP